MKNSSTEQFNELELLSIKISDLVYKNQFDKIEELDVKRRKIIRKLTDQVNYKSKKQVENLISSNIKTIDDINVKIKKFTSNRSKFSKRLQFYSLSK